jgi:hypothetical protein
VTREEATAMELRLDVPALVAAGVGRVTEEAFDFPPGLGPFPRRGRSAEQDSPPKGGESERDAAERGSRRGTSA